MSGCTDCNRHKAGQRLKKLIPPMKKGFGPSVPIRKSANSRGGGRGR